MTSLHPPSFQRNDFFHLYTIFIIGVLNFPGAYFGEGGGPIHYDHIVCSGMEYNLTDCETGTGTRESSHDEDVGVKCNTGKFNHEL